VKIESPRSRWTIEINEDEIFEDEINEARLMWTIEINEDEIDAQ